MTAAHSYWSASGFESVMLCPGKKVMEAGKPDSASIYAAEGTCAHQVLTWALQQNRPAADFIGYVFWVNEKGRIVETNGIEQPEWTFTVDEDMAGHAQVCVDYVQDVLGDDGALTVDVRVNYAEYLGVDYDSAWGTADVIVLKGDEIIVIDFKYGMGVEVSAEDNPQMSLYALGALAEYGAFQDFSRARLVISQPRVTRAPSEFDLSVDELVAWGTGKARSAVLSCQMAEQTADASPQWNETYLRPGEKQCKFCRAKATCPTLRAEVASTVFDATPASPDDFADAGLPFTGYDNNDPEWLAACLSKVDLIEDWCKAIRAETEKRLLAGDSVPGYKLVQGKKGNRKWSSVAEAEEMLKAMRVKHDMMYDYSLISPTSAEKLAKAGHIGQRQWPKLQGLITQSEGKPHVAPLSDPRPALDIVPVADEFENVADASANDFA